MSTMVILIIILPFCSPVIIFFLLLRKCVAFAAKIFKRGTLVKIVPGGSTLFGNFVTNLFLNVCKSLFSNKSTHFKDGNLTYSRKALTIISIAEIDRNKIGMTKLKSDFEEKLLHKKIGSHLLYVELRCKLVAWWGYYFWEKCDNFDVNDHLKFLPGLL